MSTRATTTIAIDRSGPVAAGAGASARLAGAIFVVAALTSAMGASSTFNWITESFFVLIGAGLLAATASLYPLTPLTYWLLLALSVVVLTGAHYTYARVPLGEWARTAWGFKRNHYDRLGHLLQGVGPAIFVRELFRRRLFVRHGVVLIGITCAICLGLSAGFEIVEWHFAAAFGGGQASEYLGAQGDMWDAQQDMQMALVGALAAQLVFARAHDRQIARLGSAT